MTREEQSSGGVDDATIGNQVAHMRPGPGGWVLSEFEWNPSTGRGELTYERVNLANGQHETRSESRPQPTHPDHDGWRAMRDKEEADRRGWARRHDRGRGPKRRN